MLKFCSPIMLTMFGIALDSMGKTFMVLEKMDAFKLSLVLIKWVGWTIRGKGTLPALMEKGWRR